MIDLTAQILDGDWYPSMGYDYELNEDGSYIRWKDGTPVQKKIFTKLSHLIREALISHNGDTNAESIKYRYDLYKKIKDKKEVELSKEEKDIIIQLICNKYSVIFTGQVMELLK